MFEESLLSVELHVSFAAFERLPRHPAYRYEYFGGRAVLTPRPRYAQALLDLSRPDVPLDPACSVSREMVIRRLEEDDWPRLVPVFAAAFSDLPPFTITQTEERLRAARACLEHTRGARDGEIVTDACLVAEDAARGYGLAGAALVTMIGRDLLFTRSGNPSVEFDAAVGERIPHLTWIFVSALAQRRGVATAMLAAITEALRRQGHDRLASTMLLGNYRTILWHWRCGFRPLGAL